MHNDEYRYKHVPLTPTIIEILMLELFSGRLVERQTIIDEVVEAHRARGGKDADAQSITSSVKRALQRLTARGIVQNPSKGYWRFDKASDQTEFEDLGDDISTDGELREAEGIAIGESTPFPIADVVAGVGRSTIYAYYLPTYRRNAEAQGESYWPCKIGRTERDPIERIMAQAATALPEHPHVALVLHTDHPIAWEAIIHGVLTVRGRKLKDSPGSEWFLTSLDEVKAIIQTIMPDALVQNSAEIYQRTMTPDSV